jgi:hypothetical protein
MPSEKLISLIWYAGTALQVAVLLAMLLRRSYRQLPIFFSYCVYVALRAVVTYFLRPYPWPYFYTMWATDVVAWALCFASIQEIMQKLCGSYPAVRELIVILFRWGGAVLVALAFFTAYVAPGADPARVMAGLLVLERSVRIVQVGLLSLLFVFAGFLRLRWPHYAFGAAFGFAIFCSVELASVTVRTHDMWAHNKYILVEPLAFLAAQATWLFYLSRPEPEPASATKARTSPKVEGWDLALAELLRR